MLFRSALRRRQEIDGQINPATTRVRHSLGRVLMAQGRDDEAQEHLVAALELLSHQRGARHPWTTAVARDLERLQIKRDSP